MAADSTTCMIEQGVSIGRIALKQKRVPRDGQDMSRGANPMNKLVPYLDLFGRLDDGSLSRLAEVDAKVVAELRAQVAAVNEGLARYADLLPRLSDGELARLTGAAKKTIRFWRLCQPRQPIPRTNASKAAAEATVTAESKPAAPDAGDSSSNGKTVDPADSQPGREQPSGQDAVSGLMAFSGDPFPGFEDEEPGRQDSGRSTPL